ncbi:HAD superfamily hydrolase (TIGR01509 family) [Sphingomonas zeicaulis]|uniref:HAD family hydrolase n=1 Tax=Sphingomonas zeicaulis TaxID=1632740 RepID=UPI003D19391B
MIIKAVLFDLDGTLVDSNDMHVSAWHEAFAGIGVSLDRRVIHDQIGKGADMLVPTLLPALDEAGQKGLGEAQGRIFKDRFRDKVRPFPGAHDLLAQAYRNGQKVVFATSASKSDLDHYVELLDARDLVCGMTSAEDVEHTKPAPDIFAMALAKVEPLSPEEALVIGDTPYDIEAAAKCGIRTVAVRSGRFSDVTLLSAGAIAIYDDAATLLADYANSPLAR